jgi:hypothetical protein
MPASTTGLPLALLLLLSVHLAAPAQNRPPIKAGLWEVQHSREVNGEKAPDLSEQLKNLPPEARKRMEAHMRQRGVEMGGSSGVMKMCLSEQALSRDDWASGGGSHCKTEVLSRGAGVWKWRSTCGGTPPTTAVGETRFQGDTAYTTVVDIVSQRQEQPLKTHLEMRGSWLSADCGQIKPIVPHGSGATPASSKP